MKSPVPMLWMTPLLLFLLGTDLQTCQCNQTAVLPCVWRITFPPSHIQARSIGINIPFQVQYADSRCRQALQWDVTGGCTVQNQSSVDASISCSQPGYHIITPIVQQSCSQCVPDSRTVAVRADPLCYRWYVVPVSITTLGSSDGSKYGQWSLELLHVWIIDWTKASTDEWKDDTSIPSQYSADLTRLFYSKGQRPIIRQIHGTNRQHPRTLNTTFNPDLGFWELTIRIPLYSEMELEISGRPEIASHMCFIRDTSVLLTNHWLLTEVGNETVQLHYVPGRPTRLVQDPCASQVALLMSESSIFITEDGFRTSRNISLPSHLLQQSLDTDVESIIFTPTHLLLLIESSVYALDHTMDNLTQLTGLTKQSSMKGVDWCVPSAQHRIHLGVSFNTSHIYLISTASLQDQRLSSTEILLPDWSMLQGIGFMARPTMQIQDVAFDSLSSKLGIAAIATGDSQNSLVFLLYDIAQASWTHLPFWLDASNVYGSVSLLFTKSAYNESLLFWDQKSLNFAYNGDYGIFTIADGTDTTTLNTSNTDVIQQVTVSPAGDVVVLMSSNSLYYSRFGLTILTRLPATEIPTLSTNILFDQLNNLLIIRIDDTSSKVWLRHYPLELQVAGAVHNTNNSCPYKIFEHGDTASMYYLDMRDAIKLWTSLTFPCDTGVMLKVVSSSPGLLRIIEEDVWGYYPGWLAVNKTLTIQPSFILRDSVDYQADLVRFTGDIIVEVGPDQQDIACKKPTGLVTYFNVGCPPGRHIRVRKPDACLHFSNYTIPRDAYLLDNGSKPQTSKVVQYDWSSYGCLVPCHYQQTFRPIIDLYDYDELVAELSSNFVIFEEQGRTDFNYNASMWQAGCQSIGQARPNSSNGITASMIYQSCFVLNGTRTLSALRSRRYEVLNRTGVTSVIWPGRNGIYQFTATIIDPGYSFCHLQTQFAVEVSGHHIIVEDQPLTLVYLGIFAFLTLAVGAISYVYFRKGHVKKLEEQLVDYDTN